MYYEGTDELYKQQVKAPEKTPVDSLVMADHPLQVKIEAGQLVIRIGVKRLAECSTGDDLGALHGRKITDPDEFCEDVVREMMIEDEQGTTPLSQFLGEMGLAAFESGSLAIEP